VPDFSDRRPDRERGTDAVLASYGFCAVALMNPLIFR